MFDDRKYRVTGPTGGPGVLGPWKPLGGSSRHHPAGQTVIGLWTRIAGRADAA